MRILLDTHVFLWMHIDPDRLGTQARETIETADNDLVLSAASAWEISIKYSLGRLQVPEPPARYIPDRMRTSAIDGVAIEHVHALAAGELPPHHRDPFDRMLVAQANVEGLSILTGDHRIGQYEVDVISAR